MEMNLPNKLTVLRVVLIPVFLAALFFAPEPMNRYGAVLIFVIASLTDLLDGKIAWKYNMVTNFGKFMDPLADKLLVMSAMVWFVEAGWMPAWAFFIVIARELAVTGLRLIAVEQGRVIAAGWSGKVKTASTMIGLCVMHLTVPTLVDQLCIWVIVLTTIYSGVEYLSRIRTASTGRTCEDT